MMSKAYPYPEIVTGEAWTVHGTPDNKLGGSTDNLNKKMTVPLNRECEYCGVNHARQVRRHELGHAKWSPKTIGKLKPVVRAEAVHALEEVRVNYLLARVNLGTSDWQLCEELAQAKIKQLVDKGSIAELILFGLASYSLSPNPDAANHYYKFIDGREYGLFQDEIKDAMMDSKYTGMRQADLQYALNVVNTFIRRLVDTYSSYGMISYRKVQKLSEPLSVILDAFLDRPPEQEILSGKPSGFEEIEESEDGESQQSGQSGGSGPTDDLEQRMRKQLVDKMTYSPSTDVGIWGDMTIHKPHLSVNLQSRLKNGRSYRPSDIGYNPKYINRFCIDRKIFKQKQTVLGGTILIDASGSMSFSGEDILDILTILPAATIAMYNGSHLTGDLRIIAKGGSRVNEEYLNNHTGRGNVVDGPALDWLATMPARRIWVSDMHVFGSGAGSSSHGYNLIKYCYDVCTKNQIINLKDMDEVKEHALKLNVI